MLTSVPHEVIGTEIVKCLTEKEAKALSCVCTYLLLVSDYCKRKVVSYSQAAPEVALAVQKATQSNKVKTLTVYSEKTANTSIELTLPEHITNLNLVMRSRNVFEANLRHVRVLSFDGKPEFSGSAICFAEELNICIRTRAYDDGMHHWLAEIDFPALKKLCVSTGENLRGEVGLQAELGRLVDSDGWPRVEEIEISRVHLDNADLTNIKRLRIYNSHPRLLPSGKRLPNLQTLILDNIGSDARQGYHKGLTKKCLWRYKSLRVLEMYDVATQKLLVIPQTLKKLQRVRIKRCGNYRLDADVWEYEEHDDYIQMYEDGWPSGYAKLTSGT